MKIQDKDGSVFKNWSSKRTLLLVGLFIWSFSTYYYTTGINFLQMFSFESVKDSFDDVAQEDWRFDSFLIDTEGCRVPHMEPYHPTILPFIRKRAVKKEESGGRRTDDERPIRCSKNGLPPLVSSNLTHIYVNKQSVDAHKLKTISCCYKSFRRRTPSTFSSSMYSVFAWMSRFKYDHDDRVDWDENCVRFKNAAFMGTHEFVKVICYEDPWRSERKKQKLVYKDFHAFTPLEKKSDGKKKRKVDVQKMSESGDKMSVLMLGLDSMSRLNFIRQMPESYGYIKNELGAIEMLGYNKVAENTLPNLITVLTGMSETELKNSGCWKFKHISYFDRCTFLWDLFNRSGYKTCYAEDGSKTSTFNLEQAGFIKQPTDYYWRTFIRIAENEIGSEVRSIYQVCLGYRMVLQVILDYAEKFTVTMKNSAELFFGLIWSASITHDLVNLPRYGDVIYKNLLVRLSDLGVVNDTVLILFSDHGMRFGGIRNTYQGHLEEKLPCLFFIFPDRFKNKFSKAFKNLQENSKKLTTPYDLHKTVLDLLDLNKNLNAGNIKVRTESLYANTDSGISLFLPIHINRTCKNAKIPAHHCACQKSVTNLSVKSERVKKAAEFLIGHINHLLKNESKCAILKVKRVLTVRIIRQPTYDKKCQFHSDERAAPLSNYVVTIEATPGGATFEATLLLHHNDTFSNTGDVSRTNLYRDQSACITDRKLALYCFCNGSQ